jgi:hypothetical protein
MPGGGHDGCYGTAENSERQQNGDNDFLDAHGSSITFFEVMTLLQTSLVHARRLGFWSYYRHLTVSCPKLKTARQTISITHYGNFIYRNCYFLMPGKLRG